MPTAIWKSRLKSGSAHCNLEVAVEVRSAHWDLELAVEVRQCPLGSGARGGGPACAHWDLDCEEEAAGEEAAGEEAEEAEVEAEEAEEEGGEQL